MIAPRIKPTTLSETSTSVRRRGRWVAARPDRLFVLPRSLAHTMYPLGHPFPTLSWLFVGFHVLRSHRPSLHRLRRRCFHRLCSAASQVLRRCSTPSLRSCTDCAFGFPCRSGGWLAPGYRRGLSVLACPEGPGFSTCSWLLDYAGPAGNSRSRSPQYCLPVVSTRSAPDMRFSKLDSRPVDASVYASPGASRPPAQDSRPRWFATPFLQGSFIPYCTPVYPDDCASLRARLTRCNAL